MLNEDSGGIVSIFGHKKRKKKLKPTEMIDGTPMKKKKKPPIGRIDPTPRKPMPTKPPIGRIDPTPRKPMPTTPVKPSGYTGQSRGATMGDKLKSNIPSITSSFGNGDSELMKSARKVGDQLKIKAEEMKRKNAGGGLKRRLPTIPKYK